MGLRWWGTGEDRGRGKVEGGEITLLFVSGSTSHIVPVCQWLAVRLLRIAGDCVGAVNVLERANPCAHWNAKPSQAPFRTRSPQKLLLEASKWIYIEPPWAILLDAIATQQIIIHTFNSTVVVGICLEYMVACRKEGGGLSSQVRRGDSKRKSRL